MPKYKIICLKFARVNTSLVSVTQDVRKKKVTILFKCFISEIFQFPPDKLMRSGQCLHQYLELKNSYGFHFPLNYNYAMISSPVHVLIQGDRFYAERYIYFYFIHLILMKD